MSTSSTFISAAPPPLVETACFNRILHTTQRVSHGAVFGGVLNLLHWNVRKSPFFSLKIGKGSGVSNELASMALCHEGSRWLPL
jgi:hypothetical protein